ncbi:hypothetical protein I4F81_004688 [Pyropia yezoensis]|uniref:Uncharacterized protein n=1 Tax=Pyropia yezoensis TaxID=2788 RepID=A0ACC3BW27_PYRYE|nr:hypothetical protein I4F81_004688 [Neopyropia yezoensis]
MDHAEEQEQEREALAAIFLDDYTPLSDDGRRLQLALSHPAAGVSAKLIVTLPPTYPEAPPAVSLHPGSGLTAPRRAALLAALDAKLTGRQLFELNKAVAVEDDSESFWEAEAELELAAT